MAASICSNVQSSLQSSEVPVLPTSVMAVEADAWAHESLLTLGYLHWCHPMPLLWLAVSLSFGLTVLSATTP
jgi:hypothetical protein